VFVEGKFVADTRNPGILEYTRIEPGEEVT